MDELQLQLTAALRGHLAPLLIAAARGQLTERLLDERIDLMAQGIAYAVDGAVSEVIAQHENSSYYHRSSDY